MQDFNPFRQIAATLVKTLVVFFAMAFALKGFGLLGLAMILAVSPLFMLLAMVRARAVALARARRN